MSPVAWRDADDVLASLDLWRSHHAEVVKPLFPLLGEASEFLQAARFDDPATEALARELVSRIESELYKRSLAPEAFR